MNESGQNQYQIDFLTGHPTAITSHKSNQIIRAACATLNNQRTRGIMEAAKLHAPSEQIQVDVWAASFERETRKLQVPVIPLSKLGISHNSDGFLDSAFLQTLVSGSEASPFLDTKSQVVYKLFDLKANGALGKKISLQKDPESAYAVELCDATLMDTMDKLSVLNKAGGHITEIVGLSENGDYLIAKQPLAYPYEDLNSDREISVFNIKGIVPLGPSLRHSIAIIWIFDAPWIVGDLHKGNIMRDANDNPTIIDALIGTIPDLAYQEVTNLAFAVNDAKDFRETNQLPLRKQFDDVDNDEL